VKKILVAVDETKGSLQAIETMASLFQCSRPETVVLLYVEKPEGRSVMDDLILSDSEMSTLRESLQGTAYQEALDRKAQKVVAFFSEELRKRGIAGIQPLVREGHPADEILNAAEEQGAQMIILGARRPGRQNLFIGSVSREVVNRAEIPVLIAK